MRRREYGRGEGSGRSRVLAVRRSGGLWWERSGRPRKAAAIWKPLSFLSLNGILKRKAKYCSYLSCRRTILPRGHAFEPHQAFFKLKHETKYEHIFVVGNTGKKFEIVLVLELMKKCIESMPHYGKLGEMICNVVFSDSSIHNTLFQIACTTAHALEKLHVSRLFDPMEIEGIQLAIGYVLDILSVMLTRFSKVITRNEGAHLC